MSRREVGVLRDSRSTSLLRLIDVGASRERHHCASADIGTIVLRARIYDRRRRRPSLMAVENEARSCEFRPMLPDVSWSTAAHRRHVVFLRATRRIRRGRKSARFQEDVAAASLIRCASP